ncbi:hypothetical protein NQ318_022950 [Aromia moschata]|uniref:Uncharacterized protein n=1 Tax=Aromia moschata TaxID=1265417 RepID=A0AAV8X1Z1_9CUCU|nr:hypothetical protein NQ318_022950 [Aromia moschata]
MFSANFTPKATATWAGFHAAFFHASVKGDIVQINYTRSYVDAEEKPCRNMKPNVINTVQLHDEIVTMTVLLWLDKDEFLKDTEQKKLEVEHGPDIQ